jgi:hypothetical protein
VEAQESQGRRVQYLSFGAEIEARVERARVTLAKGRIPARVDVLREAIERGLADIEREAAAAGGPAG